MIDRVLFVAGLLAWLGCGAAAARAAEQSVPVRKVAEDFEQTAWLPNQWSNVKGRLSLVSEPAPDVKTGKSLQIEVFYSGQGFEHFTADPPAPLWIPGEARSVKLRYKISDGRYALKMDFVDGWGRDQVAGTYLSWDIHGNPPGQWATASFKVPAGWVRPLRISGLTTHNWEARNAKNTLRIQVDDIEVETDIKDVDGKTGVLTTWVPEPRPANPAKALKQCPPTPLVAVEMTTAQESNVFTRVKPQVCIRLRNWKPGELSGRLTGRLCDAAGTLVDEFERPISADSSASVALPLKAERFGLYTLSSGLSLSDGSRRSEKLVLARLPAGEELTAQQKLASPYGLNVHSGGKIALVPFRQAGIVWFREYAFSYDWLLRAKGDDGRYAGWPDFRKIVGAYAEADCLCLPVLQKSIKPPEIAEGKAAGRVGPDRQWIREICSIINAFPQIAYWELDNEYDLPADHWKAEQQIDWANYRAYHRQFADILKLLGGGELAAVENGRAGIWPQRLLRCVQSGDFQHVAVVNSHHYCGPDAPETNLGNFNMGSEGKQPALLFDELRAVRRAAAADGQPRQSWLTEFGWDTLAGPVVSPYQQAVYLPRAWMLAMAAGCDKAFWFYNFDAPDPKQFFDGCGLLGAQGQPKLALCSMAGLTSALPDPRYVGDLEAGPNTGGYVFSSDGRLVAALWTIQGDDGPTVRFQAARLQDYLGNPLEGNSVRLTMAPVYALGLSKSDVWYQQTAYSLETPRLVPASAGDPVRTVVRVTNNRSGPLACHIKLALPEAWRAEPPEASASLAPGKSIDVPLLLTIAPTETPGFKDAALVVSEGGPIKRMAVKVLVQSPLTLEVGPMEGPPGPTQVTVKVGNRSARPIDGVLRMHVPQTWQAATPEIPIAGLKPQEVRAIACKFQWSPNWQPQETAQVVIDFGPGKRLARALIPNQYAIHRAGKIRLDGRLADWGPQTQLPDWLLGSTAGESQAVVHLAWATEGIYTAVVVHDSKLEVKDPRSFWAGDTLEMFLDTADDKRPRAAAAGDHQFWLVPLPDASRVYLGRWKMKDEIAATRYDIPGIKGVARRTPDGYVMEFLLPAEQIEGYRPRIGARLGVNLNLTIRGRQLDREAYWPSPKNSGATTHPNRWGTLLLVE